MLHNLVVSHRLPKGTMQDIKGITYFTNFLNFFFVPVKI